MGQLIKQHNNKLLTSKENEDQHLRKCNCRNKTACPMNGECLQKCIVYQATVTCENETKTYIGQTEDELKSRFNNHKKSLSNYQYMNETTLSKHIWSLKENDKSFTVNCEILEQSKKYKGGPRFCSLCQAEKYHILTKYNSSMLN